MILPNDFLHVLTGFGDFFTGVPDSQLQQFCPELQAQKGINTRFHIVAANEGNDVALAAGYHLSTGKVATVYMQNSGLGNAVNPVTSIIDPEVYGIPMILVVGWRGEPGIHDEPQHVKMGKITRGQLELLGVESMVLDVASSMAEVEQFLQRFKDAILPAERASHSGEKRRFWGNRRGVFPKY
jgi:phosphonopyruvate decarboxylase